MPRATATRSLRLFTLLLAVVAASLAAGPALAHTGVTAVTGFGAGLAHPLGGADHIAAMVLAGALAWRLGGRARWQLPAAFLAMMVLGALAGTMFGAGPVVEFGILGSVLVIGGLVVLAPRIAPALAAGIAGGFAIFHGLAHGAEIPAAVSGLTFGAGFLAASAALVGLGLIGARMLARPAALAAESD